MKPLYSLKFDRLDPMKPHFIHSSDIPNQVLHLLDLFIDLPSDNEVELIEDEDVSFNINVQLDPLLARSKDLKTSQLISQNLICMVKSDRVDRVKHEFKLNRDITLQLSREMFLVNLKLTLHLFKVKDDDINLTFTKDQMYQLYDKDMVEQISKYIICKFQMELANLSKDATHKFPKSLTQADFLDFQMNDISDSTLDGSMVDKTFSDTSSLEELDFVDTITVYERSRSHSHPKFLNNRPLISGKVYKSSIDNGFIENQNNLRHNEDLFELEDEIDRGKIIRNQQSQDYFNFGDIQRVEYDDLLQDPFDFKTRGKTTAPTSRKSSGVGHEVPDDLIRLTRNMSSGYISPRRLSTKSSANTLIVGYDDDDIEYDENNVPNYIRENKKFKFIKVGKVQKFVNLFEEKRDDRSPSPKVARY